MRVGDRLGYNLPENGCGGTGRFKELLRRVSIFSDLDDEALALLEDLVHERTVLKDCCIVGQNEPGDSLFIVARGRAKAVLYGQTGREITLYIFEEGDFFGEMSLIDNQPRSVSVEAQEETTLLVLKRDAFQRFISENPQTALSVLREMSRRLRNADEIIGSLALLDVYGRVARMLRDMAARGGEATDGGVLIRHRPTQQELASMLGTSRETVSRVLGDMARRGFIEVSGKKVLLRNSFLMDEGIMRL